MFFQKKILQHSLIILKQIFKHLQLKQTPPITLVVGR